MPQVDAKGNQIVTKEKPEEEGAGEATAAPAGEGDDSTPAQVQTATLWKRINPGCMISYTNLPDSTYDRNFQFSDQNKEYISEDKDWTYHFRKTEISEYTEAAVRHKMTGNPYS